MSARVRELLASLSTGVPRDMLPAELLRGNQASSGWAGANPHGGSHCPDDVRAHGLGVGQTHGCAAPVPTTNKYYPNGGPLFATDRLRGG
jgi:hypothetical protein